jgi:hypothetical protein
LCLQNNLVSSKVTAVDTQLNVAEELPEEYRVISKQAFADLLSAANGGTAEGWINVKRENGVLIEKNKKGSATCYKGTTNISAVNTAVIQSSCVSLEALPTIDPLFKQGRVLKTYSDNCDVRLLEYEGRKCITKMRTHFVVLVHRLPPLEDGTRVVVVRSITYSNEPVVQGSTLGNLSATGWIIRPNGQTTYVCQVNLEGIPQTLVNLASREIPLVSGRLRVYITGV